MKNEHRVIIIGAGVLGVGIARDLSLRGLPCLLLEESDLGSGASGKALGVVSAGAGDVVEHPAHALRWAQEYRNLQRILPQCIDECGGVLVARSPEDEDTLEATGHRCREAAIFCRDICVEELRESEPLLTGTIHSALQVEALALNPLQVTLENAADALRNGSRYLRGYRVTGFERAGRKIRAVHVLHRETGQTATLEADQYIITAGAWSGRLAGLAGCATPFGLFKETTLLTVRKLSSQVVSWVKRPGEFVTVSPGGYGSLLGAAENAVNTPQDTVPTIMDVDGVLNAVAPLFPSVLTSPLRRSRAAVRCRLKAGLGSQPLAHPQEALLCDHVSPHRGGVDNLLTIAGGEMGMYRYSAEQAADIVAARLGVEQNSLTAHIPVPGSSLAELSEYGVQQKQSWRRWHQPSEYLICSCEVVPCSGTDTLSQGLAVASLPPEQPRVQGNAESQGASLLPGLSALTRTGRGECLGLRCGLRLTARLYEQEECTGTGGLTGLTQCIQTNWQETRPVLWGEQMGQWELQEAVYCGFLGLEPSEPSQ